MKRWTRVKVFQKNGMRFRISKFQSRTDKTLYCAGIKPVIGGEWTAFTLDGHKYSDLEHQTAEAATAHAIRYAEFVYGNRGAK